MGERYVNFFGDVFILTIENIDSYIQEFENKLENNQHKTIMKRLYTEAIEDLKKIKEELLLEQ